MEEKYYKNSKFSLIQRQEWFLEAESKPVLQVDRTIGTIWSFCEGRTFQEIYHRVNQEIGVSNYLLRNILSLMLKGNLIHNSSSQGEEGLCKEVKEQIDGPLVSIVILNHNGEVHLRGCLDSIRSQTYRNLETLVVDNASTDNSRDLILKDYPWVNLVPLKENTGFAVGNNAGMKKARGEYVLLLNNDTILDPRCVAEALQPFSYEEKVGAVALKLRLYPLTCFLNSLGNSVRDHGWGSDNYFGHLDLGQHDYHVEVFSVCFAGVLIHRKTLEEVGLLDPDYFVYYEDVDWCFRTRRLGWKILAAPRAIVYHKFGGYYEGHLPSKLRLVLVNRIRFVLKNLGFRMGLQWIRNYVREDFLNFVHYFRVKQYQAIPTYIKAYGRLALVFPKEIFRRWILLRTQLKRLVEDENILQFSLPDEEGLGGPRGVPLFDVPTVRDYYSNLHPGTIGLPGHYFLQSSNEKIHFYHLTSGLHLLYFYGKTYKGLSILLNGKKLYVKGNGLFQGVPVGLVELHDSKKNDLEWINDDDRAPAWIERLEIKPVESDRMKKVLLISDDTVGTKMAGPGIRAWELSRVLSRHFDVTLLVPDLGGEIPQADFQVYFYSLKQDEILREKEKENDFIIVQGFVLEKFPFLGETNKILIVDFYVPFLFENLFIHKLRERGLGNQMQIHQKDLQVLLAQLRCGDYFLCANERQKDLLIGMLTCLQKIDPLEIENDPSLSNLIGIVPFGLLETLPIHSKQVLKGVVDGIHKEDFVLIWGGSISNWFDLETLMKAMKEVSQEEQKIKLFFPGTKHPNPLLPENEIYQQTLDLSRQLGLINKTVFFGKDWIPYEERVNYLLESDCGVSTHLVHLETRFSFRTRMLDYFWCSLPAIVTEGDFFSEKIGENGGGIVVPEGNKKALAEAILKMYQDQSFRKSCSMAMKKMGEAYHWSQVSKPLIEFLSKNFMNKTSKLRFISSRLDETYPPGDPKEMDPIRYAQLEEFHRVVNASVPYKIYRFYKNLIGK